MPPQNGVWCFKSSACPGTNNLTHRKPRCQIQRSWCQRLSLGGDLEPKFWKMGTKLNPKGLPGFEWLSGAPWCSVSGPQRAERQPGGNEGQMTAAILLGRAVAHEEPMEWAQQWAQATPCLLVTLMPCRLLPSPGGKHSRDRLPRTGRWEVVSNLTRKMGHCVPPAGIWPAGFSS